MKKNHLIKDTKRILLWVIGSCIAIFSIYFVCWYMAGLTLLTSNIFLYASSFIFIVCRVIFIRFMLPIIALGLLVALILKKYRISFKISLTTILFALSFILVLSNESIRQRFLLSGFSKKIMREVESIDIKTGLEDEELLVSNYWIDIFEKEQFPDIAKPFEPRLVRTYNYEGKRAIELVYGKGLVKHFGFTIFNDKPKSFKDIYDYQVGVFKEVDNILIWYGSE